MNRRNGALVLAFLLGCSQQKPEAPASALRSMSTASPGSVVDLVIFDSGEWSGVFIFGPYAPASLISECLGGVNADDMAAKIRHTDGVNLVVFRTRSGELRDILVPRSAGDFVPLAVNRGYDRSQARFVVRPDSAGWRRLEPIGESFVQCGKNSQQG